MKTVVRSLLIVVGIPALFAFVYFTFIASDIYVSEAKFAIRSSKPGVTLTGVAALLGGAGGSGDSQNSIVVEEYIHSQDMLNVLEKKLSLFDQYADSKIDFVAKLNKKATKEEFLEYMIDKVEITRDETSNIISLRVKAFTAELARSLALEIISLSESIVNRLSIRMETDTLDMARKEVDRALDKAYSVNAKLLAFRNNNKSIDPAAETSSVFGIVSSIESKLAETRASLSEKRSYMRESSQEIQSLINRQNALQLELQSERKRLAGSGDSSMSGLIEQYQPLVLEQELIREQYTAALASQEASRIEAQRKKQYLIPFVLPSLPDDAVEPRRLMGILNVAMFAFLFYSIGGLMWSALRDHIGR